MNFERRRVLIVDDSEDITRLLSAYFKRCGYDAYHTNDPQQVVDMIQTHNIEVVLLDIEMPYVSGLELLKRLRSTSAPIGIIMVSGYVTLANRIAAFRWGADFIFPKPIVDLTHLQTLVEHCLFRIDDWQRVIKVLGCKPASEDTGESIAHAVQSSVPS